MCSGQQPDRSYSDPVPIRVIALVLALLVAAGCASQASAAVMASPDVAGVVGDGVPDLDPAVVVTAAVMAEPARRELRPIVAPPSAPHGRLHGVSVFRPPR